MHRVTQRELEKYGNGLTSDGIQSYLATDPGDKVKGVTVMAKREIGDRLVVLEEHDTSYSHPRYKGIFDYAVRVHPSYRNSFAFHGQSKEEAMELFWLAIKGADFETMHKHMQDKMNSAYYGNHIVVGSGTE